MANRFRVSVEGPAGACERQGWLHAVAAGDDRNFIHQLSLGRVCRAQPRSTKRLRRRPGRRGWGRLVRYLLLPSGRSHGLYRNFGGGRVGDITEGAGVASDGPFSSGPVFGGIGGDCDLGSLVNWFGGGTGAF